MEEKSRKRKRRTSAELDHDMLNAIEVLVTQRGFIDIPVTDFIAEAKIDPSIFYRRYTSVYDVYRDLAKRSDFWVKDDVNLFEFDRLGDKKYLATVIQKVRRELDSNIVMQKLLLWELSDENEITKHSSWLRDNLNCKALFYYKHIFKGADFNMLAMMAIVIAGIYFLTLHRGIATFCMIDFGNDEGKKILDDSIEQFINMLFYYSEQHQNQIRMVKEMSRDGITDDNICKYLNITPIQLKEFLEKALK